MRIGELSRQTGISSATIRFYEKEGLLEPTMRHGNGYREYDTDALKHLMAIRCAKELGFSLEEIRQAFGLREEALDKERIFDVLDKRAEDINSLIERLNQQQSQIKELKQALKATWDAGQCLQADEFKSLTNPT